MVPPLLPSNGTLVFSDPVQESQLALGWRTDCLGVCGDRADIHSIVLGLMHPLQAVLFFFSFFRSSRFCYKDHPERLKGADRHPHLRVCAILFK